ncbi:MAG TPA: DHHA1 domain-containing protein, partial [Candidatus Obscuribacterales bacterium]
ISNFAEINFARSLGVETIIVDHHSMPEMLPPAVAILHPKLLADGHPLGNLSGVGVAFKLCEALLMDKGMPEQALDLLDFVTLGLIADMVPLLGENRYLVQLGLPRLAESKRPGVQALLARAKGSNGSDLVGFGLAPRINAAGRLSDANLALELMVTEDAAVAERLARQLELENARRQELCEKIALEADQMTCQKKAPGDRGVVLYKEGWHHGVVGIVASRLVEKHHCAVFIGELDAEERVIKGSARGIEGLDLYEVLKANEHLLIKWGGHKMAAGFSLELDKAEAFSRAITQTCNTMLAAGSSGPSLEIDACVSPAEVSLGLARQIERLAPFGMSNRKPVLVLPGLFCQATRLLGKEGKHSRITLCDSLEGRTFEAVLWNSRGKVPVEGSKIDVAFTPELNAYNGQERLQLVLADWRRCDASPAGQAAPAAVADDHPPIAAAAPVETPLAQSPEAPASAAPGAQASGRQDAGATRAGTASPAPVRATASELPDRAQSQVQRPVLATGQVWKDLRNHETPLGVLSAAVSKLGARVSIFAELQERACGVEFLDRTSIAATAHLLVWQYPPSAQVFQNLVARTQAKNIYLVGGARADEQDAAGFLKRLLAVVRFAVNQREGKAEGEKVAAALGTTKVAVALGLTLLRKINVIDWFAEDGLLYLDILDQPQGRMEDLPEFRQLAGSLKEIYEFRQWCSASRLKDIQLLVVPNHVELARVSEPSRRQDELYAAEDPTVDRRDNPLYPIASDAGAV